MDTFYPPSYRVQEKIQEYIDNALKDINQIVSKVHEDLDNKDYEYFEMLLKEELGE
jgi:hypothetical protein